MEAPGHVPSVPSPKSGTVDVGGLAGACVRACLRACRIGLFKPSRLRNRFGSFSETIVVL